jgi:hypothetical protein
LTKEANHTLENGQSPINGAGKLGIHLQKNETIPHFSPCTKINSKQIKDLNISPQTMKLLEESIGVYTLGYWNEHRFFFDRTPKHRQQNQKCTNRITTNLKVSAQQRKQSIE